MKIFLVRHGESEGNVIHEINDDPGRIVNLTEKGRAQAEAASEIFRAQRITHAYASEFARTRQTAAILLRGHRIDLHVDARLNERRSGMDGYPVAVFNDLVRDDPLHFRPDRGESFLEQMERLRNFLDEIYARHPDGTVLAVSHENPIIAAKALRADDPEGVVRDSIANCGWLELDWP